MKGVKMRFSNAVLALAVVGVGAAQMVQRERHHRQRAEMELTRLQHDWLGQMATNPDLASAWKPEGMDVKAYLDLLPVNQQLCAVSLRHRLGLARGQKLRFYAETIMENPNGRTYWENFGRLHKEEGAGDKVARRFNTAMDDAYTARPETDPVGV